MRRTAHQVARRKSSVTSPLTKSPPSFDGQPDGQYAPPIEIVNAFWQGDKVILVQREDGVVKRKSVPAEYTVFFKQEDIDEKNERKLRNWGAVHSMRREGSWWRLRFRSWAMLKKFAGPGGNCEKSNLTPYEADVNPVRRWLTDNNVHIQRPKRCYIDFEADSRVPIVRQAAGEARTLLWSLTDDEGSVVFGVLEEDTDESEITLLTDLWDELLDYDQVCAWNGDRYDFPLLKNRSEKLGIRVEPRRWLFLDHMNCFKRYNMNVSESGEEKESMALGRVAEAVLGRGKLDVDIRDTYEIWQTDRQRLIDYCIEDSVLMRDIEEETGYLELHYTVCEVCTTLPNSNGTNPTNFVEGFMLKLGLEHDHHFPTMYGYSVDDKFEGAFVLEPVRTGILENVHVCDFASLYPSIIISWNMSPETLVDYELVEDISERPTYLQHLPPKNNPIPENCCAAPITNKVFRTDVEGLLPIALKQLLELRSVWKKRKSALPPGTPEWKEADRRAGAYKIAANSFYGVQGSMFSRFHVRDVAESIAQGGKWLILETIKAAEEQGFQGIYGDSVTGDRTIVVKSPNGQVRMVPASRLWGLSTGKHFRGEKEVGELKAWKALSAKGTETGWFPIEHVIRHRSGKKTCRISTKHGQTQVTTDHGIMADGKETTPQQFISLKKRFTKISPHKPEGLKGIDLLDYLDNASCSFEYKGRTVTRTVVPSNSDPGRLILDGWGSETISFQRFYKRGSAEFESLLRLVAAYACDGSSSVRGEGACRHLFSLCKTDISLMKTLASDLARLMKGGTVTGPMWTETTYVVRSGSGLMAVLFKALCGAGSKQKRLPSFCFELDSSSASIFLQGLVNGDGYINKQGTLDYTSTSQELAAGVSYFLEQHGHNHSFWFRPSKCAWSIKTRKNEERSSRYTIKDEWFEPGPDEYVYDLSVRESHTFVDGIGRVLLHNTDSAFVEGGTDEQFQSFVDWANKELYPRLLKEKHCPKNTIKLSYEKKFSRLVMLRKKRYAGKYAHYEGTAATEDSKPEIKGLEFKRGDTIRLARDLQLKVVQMLLFDENETIEDYRQLLLEWRNRLLKEPLELKDVRMSNSLSRDPEHYHRKTKNDGTKYALPSHVEVALSLREQGHDVGEGVRIEYIITDGRSPMKAIPAYEYDGTNVDRYHLWENLVYPPTMRVLEAAIKGHKWKDYKRVRPTGKGRGVDNLGQGLLF